MCPGCFCTAFSGFNVLSSKHIFHVKCACNQQDPDSDSFDAAVLSCPTCQSQGHLGSLSNSRGPVPAIGGSGSAAPSNQSEIKDLITAILAKVEGIERRLQDLFVMREQLRDLPAMRAQLARTEELAASVRRIDVRQASLDARICAFKTQLLGSLIVSTCDLEERLEALGCSRLSNELILFVVKELPSEDVCTVVASIAATLGHDFPRRACLQIPPKSNRPCLIIVRLSSS